MNRVRLVPEIQHVIQKGITVLRVRVIKVCICHGHDFLDIGISHNSVSIFISKDHVDARPLGEQPAVRIVFCLRFIKRIVESPHTVRGKSQLCSGFCRLPVG